MKQFPIMVGRGTKGPCPSSIPWDAIAPYETMALVNHHQTIEALAQRGGLDPVEAFFVMTGRTWRDVSVPVTDELEKEACAFLDKIVRDREELRAENAKLRADLEHAKVDRDCCCAGTEELRKKLEVADLQVRALRDLLTARHAMEPQHSHEDHDCAECQALAETRVYKKQECEHNWVDARNEIVKNGEICLKCYAIRAENAVTEKRNDEEPVLCGKCGTRHHGKLKCLHTFAAPVPCWCGLTH